MTSICIDLEKWNVAPGDWALDFNLFPFVIWDKLKSMIMNITRKGKSILPFFQQAAMINLKLYGVFTQRWLPMGPWLLLGKAGQGNVFAFLRGWRRNVHSVVCSPVLISAFFSTGLVSCNMRVGSHLWILLQGFMPGSRFFNVPSLFSPSFMKFLRRQSHALEVKTMSSGNIFLNMSRMKSRVGGVETHFFPLQ